MTEGNVSEGAGGTVRRENEAGIAGWPALAVVLAMLAAVVLPRWQAMLSNLRISDDWSHGFEHHLANARLIPALDAYLGDLLTGGRYLATLWPTLISAAALMTTGWLVLKYLARLGVAPVFATAAILCWLAHPALNEYLLWKVASGGAVSLAVAALSFHILDTNAGWRGLAAATVLFILAVTSYQVLVVLPLMLFGLRLVLSAKLDRTDRRLWQVPLMMVVAAVLAVAASIAMEKLYGGGGGDGRGLVSLGEIDRKWFLTRILNALNLLANLSQQGFGIAFGVKAAWSYWYPPYFLLVVVGLMAGRPSLLSLLLRCGLPILLILAPAAIWFFLNKVHANPRIAAMGILVYFCTTWGVLGLGELWRGSGFNRLSRIVAVALLAVFAAIQVWGTWVDGELRRAAYVDVTAAMDRTRRALAKDGFRIADMGLASVRPTSLKGSENETAPVVSFQTIRVSDYLPFKSTFPMGGMAREYGFAPDVCAEAADCRDCEPGAAGSSGARLLDAGKYLDIYLLDARPGRDVVCLISR